MKKTSFIILIITAAIAVWQLKSMPTVQNIANNSDCPDDGARLAISGICQGRAVHYLNNPTPNMPFSPDHQHCQWRVNETAMPGDEVLLYLAAQCGQQLAALAFSGGAHHAELSLVKGPYFQTPLIVATLFSFDGDLKQSILQHAKSAVEDEATFKDCHVVDYVGLQGGYQVDNLSPSAAKLIEQDGPRTACGPLGLDQDSPNYWKVAQGFTWYLQPEIDAYQSIDLGSMVLVHQDAEGNWQVVEPLNY